MKCGGGLEATGFAIDDADWLRYVERPNKLGVAVTWTIFSEKKLKIVLVVKSKSDE